MIIEQSKLFNSLIQYLIDVIGGITQFRIKKLLKLS